jgi:uncharacterized Zn-binding protein involved in type VI secretion
MGLGAGRIGADSAGGQILTGAKSVIINGLPAARILSVVRSHGKKKHKHAHMAAGDSSVIVEGLPICRTGHTATCGHRLNPGSPDVMIG